MTSALPPTSPPAPPADPPGWQPPPPPPPGPPARPQLRRSRTDKVIGGVSGGLAEYSGIDPLLFRIGFVALAFAGGSGVLVYLLLWLLMPAGPYGPPGTDAAAGPSGSGTARPAGPRSPVPGVTLAGLLIVVGVLVLLARFTDWDLGARDFLGAALLVVGLGLVVSAFTGGRTARGGLITLGVLLSLALILVSALPWAGVRSGIGDRTFHPDTAREVRSAYHGGIGDMTLDLTDVDVSDLSRPIVTRVDAGVGDVDILVPRSADVEVDVNTGIGTVDVLGERNTDGGYYRGSGSGSWSGDDEPEFVIRIHAGIGDVEVSRG